MKPLEITHLMHAVLDGEATTEDACVLDRLLAEDPAARAEFDQLRRLFDGLADIPKAFPPEGLVAAVMAGLPEQAPRKNRFAQLFSSSNVIRLTSKEARVRNPGKLTTAQDISEPGPFLRGANMSEQQRSFGKRKVWIGAGIAAAAAIVVVATGVVDFPPSGKNVSGTIAPAQRYRADQPTAGDVKLGGQGITQSTQNNTSQAGPGANGPGANGPAANGPSANGPSANGPSANGPSANGPSANGPSANGPSANGPSANGPSANGPSANGPSANSPSRN